MEYTTSIRGARNLIYNGYRYYKKREQKSGEVVWWCIKDRVCRGKVVVKEEQVLREEVHQCVPDIAKLEVTKAVANAKKRAREEDNVTIAQIYKEEFEPLEQAGYEFVTRVPQLCNIKSTLHKARNASKGVQAEPAKRQDVDLDPTTLTMSDGTNFLLADDFECERIIIFSSSKGKQMLESCKTFFLDSTFKSCSKQFTQIYTIHADLGSTEEETNVAPVLFALLPNKTKETYIRMLKLTKQAVPKWNPTTISLDFEAGAISAVREELPDAKLHGCLFHFAQCNWRKVQECGLANSYKDNADMRQCVRMCVALAFLKPDDVEAGWLEVYGQAPVIADLDKFFDYFVEQWLDNPNIAIEMWNCYGKRHRTNNAVEGWNSKLNHMVRPHPRIRDLVCRLKKEAESADIQITRMFLGLEGNKRRKKYCSLDERIKRSTLRYEANGDIRRFLKHLSYVLKMD